MHRIAGVVIVSGALMRYGRMVVSVRQGADVPYQRERQQEQNPMETTGVPGATAWPQAYHRHGTRVKRAVAARSRACRASWQPRLTRSTSRPAGLGVADHVRAAGGAVARRARGFPRLAGRDGRGGR